MAAPKRAARKRPATPSRHLRDHEVGKDLVGFDDSGGKAFAGDAIERPEQAADEHEGGPDRETQRGAHANAAQGGAVRDGGEIALHDGLVRGVLLQVEEEAVEAMVQKVCAWRLKAKPPSEVLWLMASRWSISPVWTRGEKSSRPMVTTTPVQRTKPWITSVQMTVSRPPMRV